MNRSEFFQSAVAAAATPTLLKDLIDIENDKVIISEPGRKKIAIDVHALTGCLVNGPGGKKFTPAELLDIYFKTGILIYSSKRPDGSEITHHPITVIE
jgi:hypothetical protein